MPWDDEEAAKGPHFSKYPWVFATGVIIFWVVLPMLFTNVILSKFVDIFVATRGVQYRDIFLCTYS